MYGAEGISVARIEQNLRMYDTADHGLEVEGGQYRNFCKDGNQMVDRSEPAGLA